ncbi:MAG: Rne/Rng family ribonuclease [Syntrophobacterales bacterium]|nr:Rne/Rng family ribonuclease [Syntrophobacterales bacterium]
MSNQILLINAIHPEEFRIALLEGSSLEGFFIETTSRASYIGNIYKGVVEQVQPSLQAAFVNYGADRNGFLPIDEIHPEYFFQEPEGELRIQDLIQPGQEVLVQVTKDAGNHKGAALTTYISLAGRYIVLMPGRDNRAISRKILDEEQRERLKRIAQEMPLPDEFGIIIRTAAANQTKKEIFKDLRRLLLIWESIKERASSQPAPSLIYQERGLAIRVIRDYFTPDIKRIVVDHKDVYREVKDFIRIISPKHQGCVELHRHTTPLFTHYRIEDQIERIFDKRVPLKSGGYLIIEQTEALVAIDVNSGGATSEKDIEETAFRVNMEAAAEIPRQLRLRDLGGLIVIDFIDMSHPSRRARVEQELRRMARKDKAKITIGKISRFGLLEMSRQHLGMGIQMGSYRECPYCNGTGMVRTAEAAALSFLRRIWSRLAMDDEIQGLRIKVSPEVAFYLLNRKRPDIMDLEERYRVTIFVEGDPSLRHDDAVIEELNGKRCDL